MIPIRWSLRIIENPSVGGKAISFMFSYVHINHHSIYIYEIIRFIHSINWFLFLIKVIHSLRVILMFPPLRHTAPGGRPNIKTSSYQYRDTHVKDKTI